MASKNVDTATGEVVETPENTEEWTIEQDETPDRLIFDTIGDEYEGLFLGIEHIVPPECDDPDDEFDVAHFWDLESPKAIAGGFALMRALRKIEIGREVRMRYVKNIPIAGQASPMKDYKVWSRPARPAWETKAAEARKAAGL